MRVIIREKREREGGKEKERWECKYYHGKNDRLKINLTCIIGIFNKT